ncbi:MAG: aldehyde ferredoxin oxidoreductase family protein, partial [Actinobacteria bacterium]|nr:aldehyde ferredoxin oxidoreductase family protein [Actinomycetota bacterium]
PEDAKNFIGGCGLGTKYLHKLTDTKTDPLGENNVLVFLIGPLTGTKFFSSNRYDVVTKSPLTGIYAESNSGGKWGGVLKKSGYDGIIISGKSESPVYIWINNKEVKIEDAVDIWGLDDFELDRILKERTTKDAEVACIGPAGERLVKYATISNEGEHARVAGRAGAGTVMGSKNLKAIVVSGNQDFELFDPEGFEKFFKQYSKGMVEGTRGINAYGTSGGVAFCEELGDLPVRNWSWRTFEGTLMITGQYMAETILKKRYYCGQCMIGCGRVIKIEDGKYKTPGLIGGPEYETIGMLGSNLLVGNIQAIARFNELCNRYGIDTITTGSVIGMAMECFEYGLLNKKDLDGIELTWGNEDAIIEIIHKIGKREGIGELLGEGTRAMAKVIGSYADEFAVHVKGLEAPAHDPRGINSVALGYATSARGACHLSAFTHDFEGGACVPDLGYPEPLNRLETKGKPEYVIKFQNLMNMFDSLTCCKFVLFGGITLKQLTEGLNLITGFEFDENTFLKTGERIFNLKRLYNLQYGITRADDILPPKFLAHKRDKGENGALPNLGEMLDEYYSLRGWDKLGIPADAKIKELGLDKYI